MRDDMSQGVEALEDFLADVTQNVTPDIKKES